MGQVYLARDMKFETRRVAVKTVRQDILNSDELQEGEAIARFEREAQAAASIQHPNTVSVTDFGESEDGIFYLVMEYVEGETLHKLLRREGTLPIRRAVRLLRQIADGVEAAHDLDILHRDLKPANIFILQKGKGGDGFIKVGDFGLAKIMNQTVTDTSSKAAPSSRGIIGTPEFMSPEQMQPELAVDKRADLYALGTIAYLMLAGKTPFSGELMQLVMQKVMHAPPPLASIRTDIPSDVDRIVMKALATNPADRSQSVGEWISELESAASDVDERPAGGSRLVILAPQDAEVYIDDERKGSVGSSGRIVLTNIPPGRHVLRVSKAGERDDERLIELTGASGEQVIQAQLRERHSSQSPTSHSSTGGSPQSSVMPGIVSCANCGARFAEGVRFCGRCGSGSFRQIIPASEGVATYTCPRCAAQLPANSRFCGRCGFNASQPQGSPPTPASFVTPPPGVPRQAERLCRRCGSAFPAHIKFCGKCGITLG
jgi:serine/threonine protein kinase